MLSADAVGQERREEMLSFTILGYAVCVLVLMRVIPRSTVVVSAVALPLGMGWVSWGALTTGSALVVSHGLGLAIAGWAALSDLKAMTRFLYRIQWRVLWYMARGEVITLNEVVDEDLDDEAEEGARA
jgi:hypothetical protein